jgi:hypothetical protein
MVAFKEKNRKFKTFVLAKGVNDFSGFLIPKGIIHKLNTIEKTLTTTDLTILFQTVIF